MEIPPPPSQIATEKLGTIIHIKKCSQHFCCNNIMEKPIALQLIHMHS